MVVKVSSTIDTSGLTPIKVWGRPVKEPATFKAYTHYEMYGEGFGWQ